MDEKFIEQADAFANNLVAEAIEKSRTKQTKPIDFDGHCECGDEIPEARIAAGYYNCVTCQSKIERRSKLYR